MGIRLYILKRIKGITSDRRSVLPGTPRWKRTRLPRPKILDTDHFGIDLHHSGRRALQTNFVLRENHSSCKTLLPVTLGIGLLRTCKKIYLESSNILYARNTWAFRDPQAFKQFFKLLKSSKRQHITSMAIIIKWEDKRCRPFIHWNHVLQPKLINQFVRLRSLHLQFDEYFKSSISFIEAAIAGGWVAENLLYFSKLPLKTVTVIITLTDINAWTVPLVGRQNQAQIIKSWLIENKVDLDRISESFGMLTPPWPQLRKQLCNEGLDRYNIPETRLSMADISGTSYSMIGQILLSIQEGLWKTQRAEVQQPEATFRKDLAFKPLKPILGKLSPTLGSVLPSIRLKITNPFTSWGRGFANTIVFPDGYDNRIPRYAFKLILWKRGLSATADKPLQQDMSFWISTNATMGIKINGMLLKCHKSKQGLPRNEWCELKHGDRVVDGEKRNTFRQA